MRNIIPAPPAAGALTYIPALQGSTENPVPTYTRQIGRYFIIGKLCFVSINIIISTMTKVTLTDNIRVSLPVAAKTLSNHVSRLQARLENGTPVLNGVGAETVSGASYLNIRNIPLAAASALLTYAITSLGVLTNTISLEISGFYEID